MINLNPKIWGPHAWFFIDSLIISLPNNISLNLQNELKHFFISLSALLPCEKCRYHFSEYIKKTDIMNINFSSKDRVLKWINNLHNDVRKRNNSKTINIVNRVKYYDDIYSSKTQYKDIIYIIIFLIIVGILIRYFYFGRLY
jgi:hypothetical protein